MYCIARFNPPFKAVTQANISDVSSWPVASFHSYPRKQSLNGTYDPLWGAMTIAYFRPLAEVRHFDPKTRFRLISVVKFRNSYDSWCSEQLLSARLELEPHMCYDKLTFFGCNSKVNAPGEASREIGMPIEEVFLTSHFVLELGEFPSCIVLSRGHFF